MSEIFKRRKESVTAQEAIGLLQQELLGEQDFNTTMNLSTGIRMIEYAIKKICKE